MNCWYTMATLRLRTDFPVMFTPFSIIRPEPGRSRPAMSRSREVLPDRVRPSRMLRDPLSKERLGIVNVGFPPDLLGNSL